MQIIANSQYTIDELRVCWQDLASQLSTVPVFLDWGWIGQWVTQAPTLPLWIVVKEGSDIVGMTLVCMPTNTKTAWFTKTGDVHYDQIWIEYNDVLCNPRSHKLIVRELLSWCAKQRVNNWVLEITTTHRHWQHPQFWREIDAIPAYALKLRCEFSDKDQFLKQCSANSRSAIRRAFRYLESQYGELKLKAYRGLPPQNIINELASLHKIRWQDTPEKSGFENPHFVRFHQQLMQLSGDTETEVLAFYAGDLCLGYTYNLLHRSKVYFYLSGINYAEQQNRFQPGLVMHTLAIAYYSNLNFTSYDFMGGDGQYKRSLANHKYDLYRVVLYKKNLTNWLILHLKKLKRMLQSNR